MNPILIPSGEPYLLHGGDVGCLLLHGFTATPHALRWMADFLAARGMTVYGVRLHGHASDPEDLRRSRWTDWMSSLEDGWSILNGISKRIYIIGHSTGGSLAMLASTYLPVAGTVGMSTLLELPMISKSTRPLLWPLSIIKPYLKKGEGKWHDPSMAECYIAYPSYPVRTIIELDRLLRRLHQVIPKIDTPVMLMHSKNDDFIPYEQMQKLYGLLQTKDKQTFDVEQSRHIITMDSEREIVFQAAYDFIQRLERHQP